MITEREKQNREKLFKLMQENPELPVIPLVDSEVVYDDSCCNWIGSWGWAEKVKFISGEERIYFNDDDPEDVLTAAKGWDWYEAATDEEVAEAFAGLPWIEAIAVYIGTPEI